MNTKVEKLLDEVQGDYKITDKEFLIDMLNVEGITLREIRILTTSASTMRIIGDGYFTDSTNTQNNGKTKSVNNVGDSTYIHFVEGSKLVVPKNVQHISIDSEGFVTPYFSELPESITYFRKWRGESSHYDNISDLSGIPNLETIDFQIKSPIVGDIGILSDKPLGAIGFNSDYIYGDLMALSNKYNLRYVQFNGKHNVVGSLEALCDALYNNGEGKTSGVLKFYVNLNNTTITYNGSALKTSKTITFTSEGYTIS